MRTVRNSQNIVVKSSGLDNAVLLLDKPSGVTSFDTISQVKRIARLKKIGHSGTLDRFASGLLVICTGQATRLTRYFLESEKRYTGIIKLGIATDTCDITGETVSQRALHGFDETQVRAAMNSFIGESVQIPPEYSSLKIRGQRASDRVRRGEKVSLEGRPVRIYRADITAMDIEKGMVSFDIACSKGTYIRAVARDLGEILGTGACLAGLRRVESGKFNVKNAASLDDVRAYVAGEGEPFFSMEPAEALDSFGKIVLNGPGTAKVLNGAFFLKEEVLSLDDGKGKIYVIFNSKNEMIGIAEFDRVSWQIDYHAVFN